MSEKQVQAIKRTESGAVDHAYYRACARDLRSQAFAWAVRLMGNALLRFIHAAVVGPMRRRRQGNGMNAVDGDKIMQEAKVGF